MKTVIVATTIALGLLSQTAFADTLVVYSAGPKPLAMGLAKEFEAKTGIKVDMFQSTAGKIMARYQAEKANPQVDVMISAAWGDAITLDQAGELAAYASPESANVPAFLKTPTYVAQGAAALTMVYNTKSKMPAPTSWADLTKPEYRDQVTMPDPASSGSALTLMQGLVTKNGDAAWDLFAKLNANGMLVAGANAAALNPVLQGERSVVFGAVDYIAMGQKAKGESIEVIYPTDGTVLAPRPIMILKSSKRQDAAKQFVDFVMSEAGQKLVANVLLLPGRTDIPAKRPGFSELSIIEFDEVAGAANAAADKAKFATIMAK